MTTKGIRLSPKDKELISSFMGVQYRAVIDWRHIMDMVEKIEEMDVVATFTIEQPSIWIYESSIDSTFESIEVDIHTKSKIEAVFDACIQFIEWYNQN